MIIYCASYFWILEYSNALANCSKTQQSTFAIITVKSGLKIAYKYYFPKRCPFSLFYEIHVLTVTNLHVSNPLHGMVVANVQVNVKWLHLNCLPWGLHFYIVLVGAYAKCIDSIWWLFFILLWIQSFIYSSPKLEN